MRPMHLVSHPRRASHATPPSPPASRAYSANVCPLRVTSNRAGFCKAFIAPVTHKSMRPLSTEDLRRHVVDLNRVNCPRASQLRSKKRMELRAWTDFARCPESQTEAYFANLV